MVQLIKVPQLPWHGTKSLDLTLPDGWEVEWFRMAGFDRPALSDAQIKQAIDKPLNSPPLWEVARNKKEAVIIVDDMTRVTRAARIVPHLLQELTAAGIPDKNIRFMAATGCHNPLNRLDFAKKLGEDVIARYRAYSNNIYENCTEIGTTSRGTPVKINTEVINCDLKIVVGSTFPHRLVSYSGAAKLILPGVAHIDSVSANHWRLIEEPSPDDPDYTKIYLDMEEAAEMAGLNFAVEGPVNEWGETVALFAGHYHDVHAASVAMSKAHYRTPTAFNKDIVIANAFAKASEFAIAMQMVGSVRSGGDLVVIGNAPTGMVVHYLTGTFGKTIGGRGQRHFAIPPEVNRIIVYNEYPDQACLDWIQESPRRILMSKWDDVITALKENHGEKASVAVYPSADISRVDFILRSPGDIVREHP